MKVMLFKTRSRTAFSMLAGINLLAGTRERVELREESDEKSTRRPPILFPAVKVRLL